MAYVCDFDDLVSREKQSGMEREEEGRKAIEQTPSLLNPAILTSWQTTYSP
jgi:hypothetical protein